MVYLWSDWGMGDSENRNRNYAEQSSCDLLRIDRDHLDDEVDLHPLTNQVSSQKSCVYIITCYKPVIDIFVNRAAL